MYLKGLPEQIGGMKDGPIGAGEAEAPIVAGERGHGGVGLFDSDDAGLAGAHAAGHGAFDGDLAGEVSGDGDGGDAFHHGFRAAGVEGGLSMRFVVLCFGEEAIEIVFEGLGDEAVEGIGAVIGGDDGGDAEGGKFGDVVEGRDGIWGRRRSGIGQGDWEEVAVESACEEDGGMGGKGGGEV